MLDLKEMVSSVLKEKEKLEEAFLVNSDNPEEFDKVYIHKSYEYGDNTYYTIKVYGLMLAMGKAKLIELAQLGYCIEAVKLGKVDVTYDCRIEDIEGDYLKDAEDEDRKQILAENLGAMIYKKCTQVQNLNWFRILPCENPSEGAHNSLRRVFGFSYDYQYRTSWGFNACRWDTEVGRNTDKERAALRKYYGLIKQSSMYIEANDFGCNKEQ